MVLEQRSSFHGHGARILFIVRRQSDRAVLGVIHDIECIWKRLLEHRFYRSGMR